MHELASTEGAAGAGAGAGAGGVGTSTAKPSKPAKSSKPATSEDDAKQKAAGILNELAAAAAASSSSPSSSSGWILILLFALFLRYAVSSGTYSGYNTPPMYGDYEAQRHWMEITVNLPIQQWYVNTTDNNLLYWGLDYPPITAYVSWAWGKIAQLVEPALVELHTSRGYESVQSKLFMRCTVLVCDILIFMSGVIVYWMKRGHGVEKSLFAFLMLIHPCFILIDHGHFQYNCVALGLVVWAIIALYDGQIYIASILYCCSIGFKQMTLYYAPAFFFYLLGLSIWKEGGAGGAAGGTNGIRPIREIIQRIFFLGIVVITTFVVIFSPFLTSFQLLQQVVHRMFPFARGLYEDKVANFWCSTSIVWKWNQLFEREILMKLSLIATLVSFLPSCLYTFFRPSFISFLYTCTISSFSFFLFSFQVHEKTILLVILPITLVWREQVLLNGWIGIIATFSMYPLLLRDGQLIPYIVLQSLFLLCSYSIVDSVNQWRGNRLVQLGASLSLVGAIVLHLVAVVLPPVPRYPDLVPMLFVLYAASHFVGFVVWIHLAQFRTRAAARARETDSSTHAKVE